MKNVIDDFQNDNTTETITHLSLCSGYEGIGIGLRTVLPNLREIAYVEREGFPIANLVAKMEAGELYALTRRVHALRPEKSVEEAVKIVGGITADQYQRARGELNLPALKRYKRTDTHN